MLKTQSEPPRQINSRESVFLCSYYAYWLDLGFPKIFRIVDLAAVFKINWADHG